MLAFPDHPGPRDALVQARFQRLGRFTGDRHLPEPRLRPEIAQASLFRQEQQIGPDLPLVFLRQSQPVRRAQKKKQIRRIELCLATAGKKRPLRQIGGIKRVAPELVVPMVANDEKVIVGPEFPRHFPHEIIGFAKLFAVDRAVNLIVVRDLVGPDDVQEENVVPRIGQPFAGALVGACITLEDRDAVEILVIHRVGEGVGVEPVDGVVGGDDNAVAEGGDGSRPGGAVRGDG